jgi:hypothetical protein
MLIIWNLESESFLDAETNHFRIRPTKNQGIPNDLVIECLMECRDTKKFSLGTKFIADLPFSIFY